MADVILLYRSDDQVAADSIYQSIQRSISGAKIVFGSGGLVEPGDMPAEVISERVKAARLVLVLIGENWLRTDWTHSPKDMDMMAIRAALAQQVRLVPVVMGNIDLPSSAGLNAAIAPLLERTPVKINNEGDVLKLVQFIQKNVPSGSVGAHSAPAGLAPTVAKPLFGEAKTASVAELSLEENAVIGRIASQIGSGGYEDLKMLPSNSAEPRTQMPNGSHVILLSRTNARDWYNVGYVSTTGQVLSGWVRESSVKEINYRGQRVEPMDLPITQFEYNTRDEVKALKAKLRQNHPISGFATWFVALLLMVGLPMFGAFVGSRVVLEITSWGRVTTAAPHFFAAAFLAGIIIYVIWYNKTGRAKLGPAINTEVALLNKILKSKTGAGTNMLNDLGKLALAAGGVAAAVGAGALALKSRSDQSLADKGAYRKYDINIKR